MTVRDLLARLVRLRPRDFLDALIAQRFLWHAARLLRSAPAGELVTPVRATAGAVTAERDREDGRRWGRAVSRAARFGIGRPKCLARSIALQRLLAEHGVAGGELHIGVRQEGGRFEAHAWVTVGGEVVGDDPRFTARFTDMGAQGLRFLA